MWVVATLASLAALIILLLCVPLDAVLNVDVYGKPKFGMKLEWLFGLVSKEIRKGEKKPEEKKRAAEDEPKRRRRRIRARTIFEILRTKGLLGQFKRLLKDVLGCFKIRDLIVNLRVGLDNPADTGLLFAIIGPATFKLSSSFPQKIKLQPAFDEAVLEGYLHGAVRLQPIQLVPPILRFAFSLATIRVIKKLILDKWRRKK